MKRRDFLRAAGIATAGLSLPAWLEDPAWEPPKGPEFWVYLASGQAQVTQSLAWDGASDVVWHQVGGVQNYIVDNMVARQGSQHMAIPCPPLVTNGGDITIQFQSTASGLITIDR